MRIYLSIPFGNYLYLLNLLEYKQYCISIRYNDTLTIRKYNRGGCDKQA